MYFFYPEASILYFIDVQEPISSSPPTFTALLRMRRIQPRIPERRSTAPSAGLPLQDKGGWGLKEHPVPATNPGRDPGIGHCVHPSGRVPRTGAVPPAVLGCTGAAQAQGLHTNSPGAPQHSQSLLQHQQSPHIIAEDAQVRSRFPQIPGSLLRITAPLQQPAFGVVSWCHINPVFTFSPQHR